MKKNNQNKLYLSKKLFQYTYILGKSMINHITSFNWLVTNLVNIDVTFKDEDLVLLLIRSL